MNKLSEKVMRDFLKTKSVEQIHFDKLQEKGLISEYENIVLKQQRTFIIKWSEAQISLANILNCFNKKPLIAQKSSKTSHFCIFYKGE